MKTLGIVCKPQPKRCRPALKRLLEWAEAKGVSTVLDPVAASILGSPEPPLPRESLPETADLIAVLGGDGTLLSVARHLHRKEVPLLGVNLGHLGFLTENASEEMIPALEAYLRGEAVIERRMMLETSLLRNEYPAETFTCLNDAVISKSALARMIHLRVEVENHWLTDMRSDGIILSTPTGSTAYNLSAGGPILSPGMEGIIVVPLCPHTLTMRPIVVDSTHPLSVTLLEGEEVFFTADGQRGTPLHSGDRLRVRRSPHQVPLVTAPDRDYFSLLREKLGWGARWRGDGDTP